MRSIQARADRAEPPATQPTSDKSPQVSPTKHSALSSHLARDDRLSQPRTLHGSGAASDPICPGSGGPDP